MDTGDLEPGYRMLQSVTWLRSLLRRDVRGAVARCAGAPIRARVRLQALAGASWSATPLEEIRVIFVNSMSDLFHEDVPLAYLQQAFEIMVEAQQHVFQVLTKRHERLAEVASQLPWPNNVWMGVSIENKRWVNRTDYLRSVPAAVRFISAEPLLGPLVGLDLTGIDWLIAGGESGPKHRPTREEWIVDLQHKCQESETAFFFKQWGGARPKSGGRSLRGREWSEMPTPRARELLAA